MGPGKRVAFGFDSVPARLYVSPFLHIAASRRMRTHTPVWRRTVAAILGSLITLLGVVVPVLDRDLFLTDPAFTSEQDPSEHYFHDHEGICVQYAGNQPAPSALVALELPGTGCEPPAAGLPRRLIVAERHPAHHPRAPPLS